MDMYLKTLWTQYFYFRYFYYHCCHICARRERVHDNHCSCDDWSGTDDGVVDQAQRIQRVDRFEVNVGLVLRIRD